MLFIGVLDWIQERVVGQGWVKMYAGPLLTCQHVQDTNRHQMSSPTSESSICALYRHGCLSLTCRGRQWNDSMRHMSNLRRTPEV